MSEVWLSLRWGWAEVLVDEGEIYIQLQLGLDHGLK